jgi:hypothetical protein
VQPEGQLERRRELPLQDHAGDGGRQSSSVELPAVDPAEDHRRAGEDFGPVREREVERRPQHGDDHVDPLVRVLGAKVVLEEEPVAVGREAGQVHRLAVDLDRARRPCREIPRQACVENGESWQVSALVVEQ